LTFIRLRGTIQGMFLKIGIRNQSKKEYTIYRVAGLFVFIFIITISGGGILLEAEAQSGYAAYSTPQLQYTQYNTSSYGSYQPIPLGVPIESFSQPISQAQPTGYTNQPIPLPPPIASQYQSIPLSRPIEFVSNIIPEARPIIPNSRLIPLPGPLPQGQNQFQSQPTLNSELDIDSNLGGRRGVLFQPGMAFVARYAAWKGYIPRNASVWVQGWEKNKSLGKNAVLKQDERIATYLPSSVDLIQFDPTVKQNLRNLRSNYFDVSSRPFCVMYENYNAKGVEKDGIGLIDVDDPDYRERFLAGLDETFRKVVRPNRKERYLMFEGDNGERRPCLYIWNTSAYKGEGFGTLMEEARKRFGFFIIGGEVLDISAESANEEKKARIASLDAVMQYTIYTNNSSYSISSSDYIHNIRSWSSYIRTNGLSTMLFSTFTPGFDDRPLRGSTHVPMIPQSVSEVEGFLQELLALRQERVVRGGPLFILDEAYEGMAIDRNTKHILPAFEGVGLLNIIAQKYFQI